MIIAHRWTIYTEQVATRAESPVHRGELLHDVLAEMQVGSVIAHEREPRTVAPDTPLRDVRDILDECEQPSLPVVDDRGTFLGVLAGDVVHGILAENPARGVVIAQDLVAPNIPVLRSSDPVDRALELLALQHVDALPVLSAEGALLGLLDRRKILGAYRRRLDELRSVDLV